MSEDVGSQFLNPKQKESFELFSDAAVAFVVQKPEEITAKLKNDSNSKTQSVPGVASFLQQTWPQYAYDTEIRGGTTNLPGSHFTESNAAEYQFDVNGRAARMSVLRVLPQFFERFYQKAGVTLTDIDYVVPHQASRALSLAMKKLGITEGEYANFVEDYGNMVSASVPIAFAKSLEKRVVGPGNTVMLCGTAAGLTGSALLLQL